jgi:DNA-binding NarL/FixJ family response regulator
MTTLIRLIIADDHALFRGGLKSLLRRQRDMLVVGEVERDGGLVEALAGTACDVGLVVV